LDSFDNLLLVSTLFVGALLGFLFSTFKRVDNRISYTQNVNAKHTTAPKQDPLSNKIVDDLHPSYETAPEQNNEQTDDRPNPDDTGHIPYKQDMLSDEQIISHARAYYEFMNKRRSLRFISDRPVPQKAIDYIVHTAGTAPSGAHCQPWSFAVVSDTVLKQKIRTLVEREEKINYERRMGQQWLSDLSPIGTTWQKPYLDTAPYLIIALKQSYGLTTDGKKLRNYYPDISCNIACGFLVSAIHHAGLVTVTTTPMNAGEELAEILGRPKNEKVVLLLPVGFPAEGATVPNFGRKSLEEIMKVY